MKTHRLVREQLLGGTIDDVFAFFTDVENLGVITPPWLGFRVTSREPVVLGEGATIEYALRLAGMPLRWRSRIVDWEPGMRFVDVQEKGPYASWRHTHAFRPVGPGVLMRDEVRYALPLGPLGAMAHGLAVRASLARIFDYRFDVLEKRFPLPAHA